MTEISRIETQRSQHSLTVGRDVHLREPARPLPAFGGGKAYPPPLPRREEYVVEFDGDEDPLHAMNWSRRKKGWTVAMLAFTTLVAAFGSGIFGSTTAAVSAHFHVPAEVAGLGVALYVLGIATGPTLWGPLSELRGRRLPLVVATFGLGVFQLAVAVGKDVQTVLISRFWAGFFGGCPLAVVAAAFSDLFDHRTRGLALTVFSMTALAGPLLAPFIAGFITDHGRLGWRWTAYLAAILAFIAFLLNVLFLHETYPPQVLVGKAAALRRRTKNWGIHAKQEEIEVDVRRLVAKNFSRPLRLLATEPVVLLLSLYMAAIAGLVALFLTAYPIAFQQLRGFGPGLGGLPFFGVIVGELLAAVFILLLQPAYNRQLAAAHQHVPVPEWRLPAVIVGAVCFTLGLFCFGWTGARPEVHWMVPTVSGVLTGFGLLAVFLQSLNYLVDTYLMFAASAIAATTLLRSLATAGFPMLSRCLFRALGLQWAASLLGCLALLLVPVPVVFYVYGPSMRARSQFATAPAFVPALDSPPLGMAPRHPKLDPKLDPTPNPEAEKEKEKEKGAAPDPGLDVSVTHRPAPSLVHGRREESHPDS
ncbi:MAG: hypothetical protein M1826_000945 [Phylliscum demangeonii]|nr:MAG: hypothetical protein M1826_000945 [Phylliscum demangeonii]